MFSYEFFKMASLFKSFKKFKSLKLITKFLSIFTIHLKFRIFSKDSQFIEKFISEPLIFFFNRTSSYRASIHVNLNFRKLLLKHSRTRQTSIIKIDKNWALNSFKTIKFETTKRQLKSTISIIAGLISNETHIDL